MSEWMQKLEVNMRMEPWISLKAGRYLDDFGWERLANIVSGGSTTCHYGKGLAKLAVCHLERAPGEQYRLSCDGDVYTWEPEYSWRGINNDVSFTRFMQEHAPVLAIRPYVEHRMASSGWEKAENGEVWVGEMDYEKYTNRHFNGKEILVSVPDGSDDGGITVRLVDRSPKAAEKHEFFYDDDYSDNDDADDVNANQEFDEWFDDLQ